MLEKSHVPEEIVDIVREHHGTSVVRYFYQRALETEGKDSVEESRFRYHFDRPKRKTAGILLLADAVEATARTLSRPTAASLGQMVDRIVDGRLEDGQLDECDLTFNDVKRIKNVFTKILVSTYHPRVDYPWTPGKSGGKRKVAGQNHFKDSVGKAEHPPSSEAPGTHAPEGDAAPRP
jgi:membrane-associated HD superfamily phosphohydrolase